MGELGPLSIGWRDYGRPDPTIWALATDWSFRRTGDPSIGRPALTLSLGAHCGCRFVVDGRVSAGKVRSEALSCSGAGSNRDGRRPASCQLYSALLAPSLDCIRSPVAQRTAAGARQEPLRLPEKPFTTKPSIDVLLGFMLRAARGAIPIIASRSAVRVRRAGACGRLWLKPSCCLAWPCCCNALDPLNPP